GAEDAAEASAVIVALVRAKGDVKTRSPDNKTTPLLGSIQNCTLDAVDALIKAGSDLSAKSAGGATALELAEIYQRHDIAAALRKAGAKSIDAQTHDWPPCARVAAISLTCTSREIAGPSSDPPATS